MKITVTQYAKSFYEATKEKPQAEVDLMVANFVKLLQKNGQLKLAKNIIEKFSSIYNSENGIVEASVVSAEKLSEDVLKNVEAFIAKKYAAKRVILTNSIEKKIKGGIIIRVGDEMMDASIIKKISNLKTALTK
jgi:F-type H+-transporting ATPase subunit delta